MCLGFTLELLDIDWTAGLVLHINSTSGSGPCQKMGKHFRRLVRWCAASQLLEGGDMITATGKREQEGAWPDMRDATTD